MTCLAPRLHFRVWPTGIKDKPGTIFTGGVFFFYVYEGHYLFVEVNTCLAVLNALQTW